VITFNASGRSGVAYLFEFGFERVGPLFSWESGVAPFGEKPPCYPSVFKALKVILDILYQYVIILLLGRHDSTVPREQCSPAKLPF